MVDLHRLEPPHVDAVARMFAIAFHDDPGYTAVFPDPATRPAGLITLFAALLRLRLRGGSTTWLAGSSEAPTGAISAAPSEVRFGLRDQLSAGLLTAPLRWGLTATMQMHRADVQVGELRRACEPALPHTWVAQIAVHPDHQKKGIGGALLRQVLDDAADQPTALMTTAPENPAWYRRFGFEERGRQDIDAGFTAWFLVHEPR